MLEQLAPEELLARLPPGAQRTKCAVEFSFFSVENTGKFLARVGV
jgi:hypothetical protein